MLASQMLSRWPIVGSPTLSPWDTHNTIICLTSRSLAAIQTIQTQMNNDMFAAPFIQLFPDNEKQSVIGIYTKIAAIQSSAQVVNFYCDEDHIAWRGDLNSCKPNFHVNSYMFYVSSEAQNYMRSPRNAFRNIWDPGS